MLDMLKDEVRGLTPKLGGEIKTHEELQSWFIRNIVEPYLRKEIGFLAEDEELVKQGRTIDGPEYDAKVGGLLFEFKKPGVEVRGKEDVEKYIKAFKDRGEIIECFVTNGEEAVYVNRSGREERRPLIELISRLKELLSTYVPERIDPKYLVRSFGPRSEICKTHVTDLWKLLEKVEKSGKESKKLFSDCFDLWERVYAEVTNLNEQAAGEVRKYANSFGIEINGTKPVKKFLFVIETYLTIFMKLLMAGIATQNELIDFESIDDLLKEMGARKGGEMIEGLNALRELPFLKGVFEYDAFDWFTEPAKEDSESRDRVENIIWNFGKAIDKVKLLEIETDLFRRVYQEFFDKGTRRALGEFYTDEKLVDEVLDSVGYRGKEILDKTVLDPACGSGTFLLRAIKRFKEEAGKAGWKAKKVVKQITESIWGIDIHPFAVAMAKVNYLLAVSDLLKEVKEEARELELPIYWSDSLATFAEQRTLWKGVVEIDITPFGKLKLPDPKDLDWSDIFRRTREGVEGKWSTDIFLSRFSEETRGLYRSTLSEFYEKFKEKEIDTRWLPPLHNMLTVYESRRKCDFILSNPPWIRKRNVEPSLRKRLSEKFDFYKEMWSPKLKKVEFFRGSMDYSVAFVESGLDYLKEDGRLGFVITSNVIRNLYAGNFRKKLITDCTLLRIKDYSFSSEPLFEAENAPLILALEKREPSKSHKLKVEIVNRDDEWREWMVKQSELPLLGRYESPWMVLPPKAVAAVRKMREGNPMLGDIFYVGRGVQTAADEIFFIEELKETDRPDIAFIKTAGGREIKSQRARIETEVIRPLVRGRNIDEWSYDVKNYIIWTHDDEDGEVREELPQEAKGYFNRKDIEEKLKKRKARTISKPLEKGTPFWIIGDVNVKKLRDKVAFQDIARKIEAVFLPSKGSERKLGLRKIILDATVYFLEVTSESTGYALAGLLNSSPVRAYISAYAMRTGARYCHHKSWMVGLIPLPEEIKEGDEELVSISKELHKVNGEDEELLKKLDEKIADHYGLTDEELLEMQKFLKFFTS